MALVKFIGDPLDGNSGPVQKVVKVVNDGKKDHRNVSFKDAESITLLGITFKAGEEVEVTDEAKLKKFRGNRHFEVTEAKAAKAEGKSAKAKAAKAEDEAA